MNTQDFDHPSSFAGSTRYAKDLTDEEYSILHTLVRAGMPIAALAPAVRSSGKEFNYSSRKTAEPAMRKLRNYKRGYGVVGLTGHVFDVVDVDVKGKANGFDTLAELRHLLPETIAEFDTPSGGKHLFIPPANMGTIYYASGGIDYLGKSTIGKTAMVFLVGTDRPKHQGKGYTCTKPPFFNLDTPPDSRFFEALLAKQATEGYNRVSGRNSDPDLPGRKQLDGAWGLLATLEKKVSLAQVGERHDTLIHCAYHLGTQIGQNIDYRTKSLATLTRAAMQNGLVAEHGVSLVIHEITRGLEAGALVNEDKEKRI
jgi:hypothetical protein